MIQGPSGSPGQRMLAIFGICRRMEKRQSREWSNCWLVGRVATIATTDKSLKARQSVFCCVKVSLSKTRRLPTYETVGDET